MSGLSAMGNSGATFLDNESKKALNVITQQYNKGVDEWFAERQGCGADKEYNRSDYQRVAFKHQNEIATFVEDCKQQGIDVVATPTKINNQYVAEIQIVQPDGRKAGEIIADFQSRTDINVREQESMQSDGNNYRDAGIARDLSDVMFVNHLDSLGQAIHYVESAFDKVDRLASQYGEKSNTDMFQQGLNDFGEANPHVNSGMSKTATVFDGNIVVMDGKVVTNPTIVENVLSQHREREALANIALGQGTSADYDNTTSAHVRSLHSDEDRSIAQFNKTAYHNNYTNIANDLNESGRIVAAYQDRANAGTLTGIEQQKYDNAYATVSDFKQATGFDLSSDGKTGIARIDKYNNDFLQNAQNAGYKLIDDYGRFDTKVWHSMDDNAFKSLGVNDTMRGVLYNANVNTKQLTTVQKNAVEIKEHLYRQEYTVTVSNDKLITDTVKDRPTIFCGWSLGSLDEITKSINTELVGMNYLASDKMKNFTKDEQQQIQTLLAKYNSDNPNAPLKEADLLNENNTEKFRTYLDTQKATEIAQIKKDSFKNLTPEQRQAFYQSLQKHGYKVEDLANPKIAAKVGADVFEKDNYNAFMNSFEKNFSEKPINIALKQLPPDQRTAFFQALKKNNLKVSDLAHQSNRQIVAEYIYKETKPVIPSTQTKINTYVYSTSGKINATEVEYDVSNKLRNNFLLDQMEKKMFSENAKLIEDIKKSGFLKNGIPSAITHNDLLEINANFLRAAAEKGYNFITPTGFDIKKLKAMSAEQLASFGATERIRDLLVSVNEKGAFGYLYGKGKKIGEVFSSIGSGVGFFISKVDGGEGFNDVSQLVNYVSKGVNYGQQAATSVQRWYKSKKAKRDLKRLNKPRKKKKGKKKDTKKKKPKKTKDRGVKPQELTEKDLKNLDKYLDKQKKLAAKTAKKSNGIGAKFSKAVDAAKKQFMESALGKAMTAISEAVKAISTTVLTVVVAACMILGLALTLIILVAVLVIALVEQAPSIQEIGNWFAAKTYSDTIAYKLYETLYKQENAWIADLDEFGYRASQYSDNMYYVYTSEDYNGDGNDEDTDIKGDYVSTLMTAEEYVNTREFLALIDGGAGTRKIVPHPFEFADPVKGATDTDVWDGKKSYDITTNLNYYSYMNILGEPNLTEAEKKELLDIKTGAESGHTSNIKDILAMVDVMYQMQVTDNDDASMQSIMGMSVEQLNVTSTLTGIVNWGKEVLQGLEGLLHINDPAWQPAPIKYDDAITYETVQSYAIALFEASHQQNISLSVTFCDNDITPVTNADGSEVDLENSVDYDVCSSPYTTNDKEFENHICHYLPCHDPETDECGGECLPTVTLNGVCLIERGFDMGHKYDVHCHCPPNWHYDPATGISRIGCDLSQTHSDRPCVLGTHVEISDITEQYPKCIWGNMADTQDVFNNAAAHGRCWYKDSEEKTDIETTGSGTSGGIVSVVTVTTPAGSSTTTSGSEPDAEAAYNEAYAQLEAYMAELQAKEEYQNRWKNNDGVCTQWWYDWEIEILDTQTETKSELITTINEHPAEGVSIQGSVTRQTVIVTLHAKVGVETVTVYKHDCKGHNATYCGGHINTNVQGNVFSVTNEQLAMAETYEEGQAPLALYDNISDVASYGGVGKGWKYELDEYGYDEIRGKVIRNDTTFEIIKPDGTYNKITKEGVDYKNGISNAVISGGGLTVEEDIMQGTAVSKGLNLAYDEATNEWTECVLEGDPTLIPYCRDIFDIDCTIKKGYGVFPYVDYTRYEGWTADNMTLVTLRMTMDWYDVYGFDMPMEIGMNNYMLGQDDVEMLMAGLETTYGADFTDTRKEYVKDMLSWVGRGHFSDRHVFSQSLGYVEGHGYLSVLERPALTIQTINGATNPAYLHNTIYDYKVSCSAGNSHDFGQFLFNLTKALSGAMDNYLTPEVEEYYAAGVNGAVSLNSGLKITSTAGLLPADTIIHEELKIEKKGNRQLDITLTSPVSGLTLQSCHLDEQAVCYVGTFSDEAILKMQEMLKEDILDPANYGKWFGETNVTEETIVDGETVTNTITRKWIMLRSGQKIYSGVPVCVDLTQMGAYSGIFLRSYGEPTEDIDTHFLRYKTYEDYDTARWNDYEKAEKAIRTTYYWLMHPDDRTYAYSPSCLDG